LNDVRVQKITNSTLSAVWNGKSLNTFSGQVKASAVVVESDDIEFYDWSLHNSCGYFWSCDDIGKCPILKLAIKGAIKSHHITIWQATFLMGIMEYTIISLFDLSYPIPSPMY
jgi:hypothetical protein